MDLHPLTTPNDVLTDCINGTLITYNGNEYILQNDMGNYRLSLAQLDSNFIPIGLKEYGNIIYIVAYNPVTKKCQVGSYPSPQTIFNNQDGEKSDPNVYSGINISSLTDDWSYSNLEFKRNYYSELIKNEKLSLYSTKDDFKLNAGDEYYLYVDSNNDENWPLQDIKFYILSEEKEVFDIENQNLIEIHNEKINTVESDNWSKVKWEIPGWLCYKPTIAQINSFDLYLTDIHVPDFYTELNNEENLKLNVDVTFSLQGQILVSANKWWNDNEISNLKIKFEIKVDNDDYRLLSNCSLTKISSDKNYIQYNDLFKVITYNLSNITEVLSDKNSIITIQATPYVIINGVGIIYDNFKTEFIINIKDIFSLNDIKVFDTYKYTINNENIILNFTVQSPINQNNNYQAVYKLYKLVYEDNQFKPVEIDYPSSNQNISNFVYNGQNILTLPFTDLFQKENIYIFELILSIDGQEKSYAVPLITSQIMNEFYSDYSQFQNINQNIWLQKLSKYISIPFNESLDVNYGNTRYHIFEIEDKNQLWSSNFWNQEENQNLFPCEDNYTEQDYRSTNKNILEQEVENKSKGKSAGLIANTEITYTLNNKLIQVFNQDYLNWDLWKNLIYDDNITSEIKLSYTGSNNKIITGSILKDNQIINKVEYNQGWYNDLVLKQNIPYRTGKRHYLYEYLPVPFDKSFEPIYNNTQDDKNEPISLLETLNNKLNADYDATHQDWQKNNVPTLVLSNARRPDAVNKCMLSIENTFQIGDRNYDKSSFNLQNKTTNQKFVLNKTDNTNETSKTYTFLNSAIKKSHLFIIPVFIGVGQPDNLRRRNCGWMYPDNNQVIIAAIPDHDPFRANALGTGVAIVCQYQNNYVYAILKFNDMTGEFHNVNGPDWKVQTNNETSYLIGINNRMALINFLRAIGLHIFYYTDLKDEPTELLELNNITYDITTSNDVELTYNRTVNNFKLNYLNSSVDLFKNSLNNYLNFENKNWDKSLFNNFIHENDVNINLSDKKIYNQKINNNVDISVKNTQFVNWQSSLKNLIQENFDYYNNTLTYKEYIAIHDLNEIDSNLSAIKNFDLLINKLTISNSLTECPFIFNETPSLGFKSIRDDDVLNDSGIFPYTELPDNIYDSNSYNELNIVSKEFYNTLNSNG